MIADLPPYIPATAVEQVVIYNATTNEPLIMVGFVAWGAPEDLAKLEAAAKTGGFPASRLEQGDPESMVIFRPDANRGDALNLYHAAISGRYGKLRVELLIVTQKDAADGITGEELRKLDPGQIRE